jgi:hypothetical protein
MSQFNRNIITKTDVDRLNTASSVAHLPKSFAISPPAGVASVFQLRTDYGAEDVVATPGPQGVEVPTADDYLTKLLKYVPLEVLGAYLFLAGVVDSNVNQPHNHAWWLGGLLIGVLVVTIPYDIRVLGIVRASQIVVSIVGLAAYVFAVGGWFATTSWYHQWYASFALPIFGLLVAIIRLKPLPMASA